MKRHLQFFHWILIGGFFLSSCSSSEQPEKKDSNGGEAQKPPEISVKITPSNPNASESLKVQVSAKEKNLTYHYQWYVNDKPLAGEVQSDLRPGSVVRGDSVYCEVKPTEGLFEGSEVASKPVTIVNSPPVISNVRFDPETPTKMSGINLELEAEDYDQDLLEFQYQWFVGNKEITEVNDKTLPGEMLEKNKSIWAKITATDGNGGQVQTHSPRITITNSPPEIISNPPELESGSTVYTYQVEAKDADGDQLSYSATGPEGISITSTGKLVWQPSDKNQGYNLIRVTVKDTEGASTFQEFEMYLSLKEPPKPQATPTATPTS